MKPDPNKKEYDYMLSERLGMMCEDREPTPEQLREAQRQALDYKRKCDKETNGQTNLH